MIAVEENARRRLEKLSSQCQVKPIDIEEVAQSKGDKDPLQKSNSVESDVESSDSHDIIAEQVVAEVLNEWSEEDIAEETYETDQSSTTDKVQPTTFTEIVTVHSEMENPMINAYANGVSQTTDSPLPGEVDPCFHFSARDTPSSQYRSSLYGGIRVGDTTNNHMYQPSHDSGDGTDRLSSETESAGGLHREMAIDVPEHFTGSRKEPPRYPPPASAKNSPANTPIRGTPARPLGDRRLMDRSNMINTDAPTPPPPLTEQEQVEHQLKIKHYKEEIRKRKEEEGRHMREQEFLRESLRGSKKLQALEEKKPVDEIELKPMPVGIVNPNYLPEDEEDSFITGNSVSKASTLPLRTRDPFDGVVIKRPISK